MDLEQKLQHDLKTAMLAGNKVEIETLRGLKSALLYAKVAANKRESGLQNDEIVTILSKEAKKRQESADLYVQGGNQERADAELAEKALIERYLPAQLSEAEIAKIIDEVITATGASGLQQMGQVVGSVKQKTGATADGSIIARLTKERLS